jgi:hypothetical protein
MQAIPMTEEMAERLVKKVRAELRKAALDDLESGRWGVLPLTLP